MSDQVKDTLRTAGLPSEVFSTTLVKQRLPDMREYITGKGYREKRIAYLHPVGGKVDETEMAFYLLAKELILTGHSTFCCSLVDIHTALFHDTDEAIELEGALEKVDFVGISHFHDKGGRCLPFLTPYEVSYFYSWMYRRYQNGGGFILLGGAPLIEVVDWWPASLVAFLRKRSVSFGVNV